LVKKAGESITVSGIGSPDQPISVPACNRLIYDSLRIDAGTIISDISLIGEKTILKPEPCYHLTLSTYFRVRAYPDPTHFRSIQFTARISHPLKSSKKMIAAPVFSATAD
jgi:hypothetical protein